MNNIFTMPIAVFFNNILENYKRKQDDLMKKKIEFLYHQAYQYFYDIQETKKLADIDLPYFVYDEKRKKIAKEKATETMLEVIRENRVNQCYQKRVKELRRIQKTGV